jgi:hypothetical protein
MMYDCMRFQRGTNELPQQKLKESYKVPWKNKKVLAPTLSKTAHRTNLSIFQRSHY